MSKKDVYKEFVRAMNSDGSVIRKIQELASIIDQITLLSNNVTKINKENTELFDKVKKLGGMTDAALIDSLSISSLKDSCEMENYGKFSKATYKDVLTYNGIVRKNIEATEKVNNLKIKEKIADIEALEAKIHFILNNSNEKI